MCRELIPQHLGYVTLKVVRHNGFMKRFYPTFYLFDEEKNMMLLTAKKMAKNLTSNYHISTQFKNFKKDCPSYVGKLRGKYKFLICSQHEALKLYNL